MKTTAKKPYSITVPLAARTYALLILVARKKGETMTASARRNITEGPGLEGIAKWMFEDKGGLGRFTDERAEEIIAQFRSGNLEV